MNIVDKPIFSNFLLEKIYRSRNLLFLRKQKKKKKKKKEPVRDQHGMNKSLKVKASGSQRRDALVFYEFGNTLACLLPTQSDKMCL
jgi:hypothetical protein